MPISYSALVLTDESRNNLLSKFNDRVPAGWEVICHHCTIKMGELPVDLKPSKGLPVQFQVVAWFENDKVSALSVVVPKELEPYMANRHPHITFAVNRAAGGKPVMSNKMIEVEVARQEIAGEVGPYFTPIKVMGQIQEVEQKQ